MKLVPFQSSAELADAQVKAMQAKPENNPPAYLVMISGGSTPRAAFEALAQQPGSLPAGMRVLLSDERVVPLSDGNSNAGWIQPLLTQAGLPARDFTFIDCDRDEEDALSRFQSDLDRLKAETPVWTDAFLGLGSDGHTCGLFSLDAAKQEEPSALAMDRADGLRGISVTRNILLQFNRCIITVSGSSKAERVKDLVTQPRSIIAGCALDGHPNVEIWGDPEALECVQAL